MGRLLAAILCLSTTGCFVFHGRYEPLGQGPEAPPPPGGAVPTTVVDAPAGREIPDAGAVIVIDRGPAYLPHSGQGPSLSPRVAVVRFADLGRVAYRYTEIHCYPLLTAFGSIYYPAGVYVYRDGYRPVEYRREGSGLYPAALRLEPADRESGRRELLDLAASQIDEEWKPYVRKKLAGYLRRTAWPSR